MTNFGEVSDQRFLVFLVNLSSNRDGDDFIGAASTVALLTHAMGTAFSFVMLLVAIVDQRVQTFDSFNINVPTAPAIAATAAARATRDTLRECACTVRELAACT